MEILNTQLGEVLHLKLPAFQDARGGFTKAYSKTGALENFNIRQVNYVTTADIHTLRGLHFQAPPYSEAKLFRVLRGHANFVFLNVSETSPNYKKSGSMSLKSGAECLLIPRGYATGYEVLETDTEVLYFSDNDYHPEVERGVLWSDHLIADKWLTSCPILSEKDQKWNIWG